MVILCSICEGRLDGPPLSLPTDWEIASTKCNRLFHKSCISRNYDDQLTVSRANGMNEVVDCAGCGESSGGLIYDRFLSSKSPVEEEKVVDDVFHLREKLYRITEKRDLAKIELEDKEVKLKNLRKKTLELQVALETAKRERDEAFTAIADMSNENDTSTDIADLKSNDSFDQDEEPCGTLSPDDKCACYLIM